LGNHGKVCAGRREEYQRGNPGSTEKMGVALSSAQMKHIDRILYKKWLEDNWLVNVPQSSIGTPVSGVNVSDWKWVARGMLDEK
jgi:hypothetical protein